MAHSKTWNEAQPAGTELAASLDTWIQDLKTAIRERMQLGGMYFPASDDADAGLHSYILFKEQASKPTAAANKFFLYTKETDSKSELFFEDEDGDEMQLTSGGDWIGGISSEVRMWSGTIAAIPTGWVFCNGSNSAPDLRDQMVICAKQDDSGTPKTNVTGSLTQSGGAATVDVSHTHAAGSYAMAHTHTVPASSTGWGAGAATSGKLTTGQDGGNSATTDKATSAASTSAVTGTSGSGGSATQAIMNPYYALAFMMKS